ncbi:hypothetical protein [Streptococcus gordonii]|uniref:hypothetical protein n=1 Tax=Streptococcus gordonii TaxID=1302 RepID=UPI000617D21E|nr:hypothetical protein [Streptococcus gordonii]AOS70848.1 hypothetical protein WH25_02800 [Streptococcus gordonii]
MEKLFLRNLKEGQLKEIITPIYDYFKSFLPTEYEQSMEKREKELIYDTEFLNKQVLEIQESLIIGKIDNLYKFSRDNNYKILKSLTFSLLTNTKQFVDKDKKFTTDVKWKKLIKSCINVILAADVIEELEYVRINKNKSVILSLGLESVGNSSFQIIKEINRVIDLSNSTESFITLPLCNCSSVVFSTVLREFEEIKVLHVAGHGGIGANNKAFLEFADTQMSYSLFYEKLTEFPREIDLIFLNCCYSDEFVQNRKIGISIETISHKGVLLDHLAYSFCESYFMRFLLYDNDKNIFNISWDGAKGESMENPFNYERLK